MTGRHYREGVTASPASMKDARLVETEVIVDKPKRFVREHLVMPDGYECDWYYTDTPPSVLVVPVTADGNLVMVRQYRHNLKRHVLEFPAGVVDDGEAIEDAARRELLEETGYRPAAASTLQPLGAWYSLPSETNKFTHTFLAETVERAGPASGDAVIERYFDMSVVELTLNDALAAVGDSICGMEAIAVLSLARPLVAQWNRGDEVEDGDLEELDAIQSVSDPVERARRASEFITGLTSEIAEISVIRQEALEELRGTMTHADIAKGTGLTRARVSQLLGGIRAGDLSMEVRPMPLTKEHAREVLDIYVRAWERQDPDLIVTIFTPTATYHERVLQEPIPGRDAIRQYWVDKVVNAQANISCRLLSLYLDGDTAIAEWLAEFDDVAQGVRKRMKEIAVLEFDGPLISSLREYWASEQLGKLDGGD